MSECRSCGAPIIWVETVTGKRMPIDAEADPDGNLHYMPIPEPLVLAIPKDRPCDCSQHYVSHFATCPQAGKWRR